MQLPICALVSETVCNGRESEDRTYISQPESKCFFLVPMQNASRVHRMKKFVQTYKCARMSEIRLPRVSAKPAPQSLACGSSPGIQAAQRWCPTARQSPRESRPCLVVTRYLCGAAQRSMRPKVRYTIKLKTPRVCRQLLKVRRCLYGAAQRTMRLEVRCKGSLHDAQGGNQPSKHLTKSLRQQTLGPSRECIYFHLLHDLTSGMQNKDVWNLMLLYKPGHFQPLSAHAIEAIAWSA